jgi:hypothetical protein
MKCHPSLRKGTLNANITGVAFEQDVCGAPDVEVRHFRLNGRTLAILHAANPTITPTTIPRSALRATLPIANPMANPKITDAAQRSHLLGTVHSIAPMALLIISGRNL